MRRRLFVCRSGSGRLKDATATIDVPPPECDMPSSGLDELEHEFVLWLRRVRRILISGIIRVA
jgi:hypothetical protein